MKIPLHPATFLSTRELQVINRFRHQRMDTFEIAKSLHLAGGEPEAVRLLASARGKGKIETMKEYRVMIHTRAGTHECNWSRDIKDCTNMVEAMADKLGKPGAITIAGPDGSLATFNTRHVVSVFLIVREAKEPS